MVANPFIGRFTGFMDFHDLIGFDVYYIIVNQILPSFFLPDCICSMISKNPLNNSLGISPPLHGNNLGEPFAFHTNKVFLFLAKKYGQAKYSNTPVLRMLAATFLQCLQNIYMFIPPHLVPQLLTNNHHHLPR